MAHPGAPTVEQVSHDLGPIAHELGSSRLKRQGEGRARDGVLGQFRLDDDRSEGLEPVERDRCRLRSPKLVLPPDPSMVGSFRELSVPEGAEIVEVGDDPTGLGPGCRGVWPTGSLDLGRELGLPPQIDLVAHPTEGVVEGDRAKLLLQAADPPDVGERLSALERGDDPGLGSFVDTGGGEEGRDLPLVDLGPEARPPARGVEPRGADGAGWVIRRLPLDA